MRLAPQVFLVGIGDSDRQDRYPACVEPEDDFWIDSSEFYDLLRHVSKDVARDPTTNVFISHPQAAERYFESIRRATLRRRIETTIAQAPLLPLNTTFFLSDPVPVEGYLVTVVLGLQTDVIQSHYSLSRGVVSHGDTQVSVCRSFIEASADTFLAESSRELQMPSPGSESCEFVASDVIQGAANRLLKDIAVRVDYDRYAEMHSLYGWCNAVASLKYEGEGTTGGFIIARRNHPSIEHCIEFAPPVAMSKPRSARKLLELASDELSLHCDAQHIVGLAKVRDYSVSEEDIFEIRVLDHHHWELAHSGKPLMRVQYGRPYLPQPAFDGDRLAADLKRMFRLTSEDDIARLRDLVEQAVKEPHGTMLVISAEAEKEAERLKMQSTLIKPCLMTPKLLRHLTPIDGAVLLSPACICYAAGVILDGLATNDGDPGRGARYNSAIRYHASSEAKCMCIVISEDGSIDIVPTLKPLVKRSLIDEHLARIDELATRSAVSVRTLRELEGWIARHSFYLLPKDCERVNSALSKIDAKLWAQDPSGFHVVRVPFAPDVNMDANEYYDKE